MKQSELQKMLNESVWKSIQKMLNESVWKSIQKNQSRSARLRAKNLKIPFAEYFPRILTFILIKKILWRTQNSDYSSRLTFSEVMHEKIQSGEILLDFITITGETLTST